MHVTSLQEKQKKSLESTKTLLENGLIMDSFHLSKPPEDIGSIASISSSIVPKKKVVKKISVTVESDNKTISNDMQEKFPEHKIISNIGSGINFKRKGLRSILEMASKGLINEVVVAYRDRLCRFAFELVEWILHLNGVKLVVLNKEMESSKSNELAEDLAIINVFNCRVNGRRKYKSNTEDKERKTHGQQVEKSSSTSET